MSTIQQETIVSILMRSQHMTQREARDLFEDMRQRVRAGDDPEEVLHEEGIEPDFVDQLL